MAFRQSGLLSVAPLRGAATALLVLISFVGAVRIDDEDQLATKGLDGEFTLPYLEPIPAFVPMDIASPSIESLEEGIAAKAPVQARSRSKPGLLQSSTAATQDGAAEAVAEAGKEEFGEQMPQEAKDAEEHARKTEQMARQEVRKVTFDAATKVARLQAQLFAAKQKTALVEDKVQQISSDSEERIAQAKRKAAIKVKRAKVQLEKVRQEAEDAAESVAKSEGSSVAMQRKARTVVKEMRWKAAEEVKKVRRKALKEEKRIKAAAAAEATYKIKETKQAAWKQVHDTISAADKQITAANKHAKSLEKNARDEIAKANAAAEDKVKKAQARAAKKMAIEKRAALVEVEKAKALTQKHLEESNQWACKAAKKSKEAADRRVKNAVAVAVDKVDAAQKSAKNKVMEIERQGAAVKTKYTKAMQIATSRMHKEQEANCAELKRCQERNKEIVHVAAKKIRDAEIKAAVVIHAADQRVQGAESKAEQLVHESRVRSVSHILKMKEPQAVLDKISGSLRKQEGNQPSQPCKAELPCGRESPCIAEIPHVRPEVYEIQPAAALLSEWD